MTCYIEVSTSHIPIKVHRGRRPEVREGEKENGMKEEEPYVPGEEHRFLS